MNVFSRIAQVVARRPFPTSVKALKACRISYSQFAEDLILSHILGYEASAGLYLDVGCYQPITWSNTFIFYQRGWSGLCIDANPSFGPAWQTFRPRDRFINAALGSETAKYSYASFEDRPACNRLVENDELNDFVLAERPNQVTQVRCANIMALIREAKIDAEKIDLLSIDVEGMDEAIIRMMDWSMFRPKAVVLEETTLGGGGSSWLLNQGYKVYGRVGPSTILARSDVISQ